MTESRFDKLDEKIRKLEEEDRRLSRLIISCNCMVIVICVYVLLYI